MRVFDVELMTCVLLNTFIVIHGTFGTYMPFFVEPYHWRTCPNGEYGNTRCRPGFKYDCKRGYTCIKQHSLSKIDNVYCGICCSIPRVCPTGQVQGPLCSFNKACPLGYTCNHGVCCLATKSVCPIGSRPVSKCYKYYDCPYGAMCYHGTCCSLSEKRPICPRDHFPLPRLRCKHNIQCPGTSVCYGNRCCQSKLKRKRPPKKAPPIFRKKVPPLITKPTFKTPRVPPKVFKQLPIIEKVPKHPKIQEKTIKKRPVVPPNIQVVTCPVGYRKLTELKCTHLTGCPGTSECISGVCCSKTVKEICPVNHRVIPEINCNLRQRCPPGSNCISGVCCLPLRKPPSCPGGLVLVTDQSCDPGACAGNAICISGSCCRVATPPPAISDPPLLFELPRVPPVRSHRRPIISTRAPIRLTMPPALDKKIIDLPPTDPALIPSSPNQPQIPVSNPQPPNRDSNPLLPVPARGPDVPSVLPPITPIYPLIKDVIPINNPVGEPSNSFISKFPPLPTNTPVRTPVESKVSNSNVPPVFPTFDNLVNSFIPPATPTFNILNETPVVNPPLVPLQSNVPSSVPNNPTGSPVVFGPKSHGSPTSAPPINPQLPSILDLLIPFPTDPPKHDPFVNLFSPTKSPGIGLTPKPIVNTPSGIDFQPPNFPPLLKNSLPSPTVKAIVPSQPTIPPKSPLSFPSLPSVRPESPLSFPSLPSVRPESPLIFPQVPMVPPKSPLLLPSLPASPPKSPSSIPSFSTIPPKSLISFPSAPSAPTTPLFSFPSLLDPLPPITPKSRDTVTPGNPSLSFTLPSFSVLPPTMPDFSGPLLLPRDSTTSFPRIPLGTVPPILPFEPVLNITTNPLLSPLPSIFPTFPPSLSGTINPSLAVSNGGSFSWPSALPTTVNPSRDAVNNTPTTLPNILPPKSTSQPISLLPPLLPKPATPNVNPVSLNNSNTLPNPILLTNPPVNSLVPSKSSIILPTVPIGLVPKATTAASKTNPTFSPTTLPPIIVPNLPITLPPTTGPLDPSKQTVPLISPIIPILQTVNKPPLVVPQTPTSPVVTPAPDLTNVFQGLTFPPIKIPERKIPRPPPMLNPPFIPPPPISIPRPPIEIQAPPQVTNQPVNLPPPPPFEIPPPPATVSQFDTLPLIPPLIPRPPPDLPRPDSGLRNPIIPIIATPPPIISNTVKPPSQTIAPTSKGSVGLPTPPISLFDPVAPSVNITIPPFDSLAPIIPPYSAPPVIPPASLAPVIPPDVPSPAGPTFPPFIATLKSSPFVTTPLPLTNATPSVVQIVGNQPIIPTFPPLPTQIPPLNVTFPPSISVPSFPPLDKFNITPPFEMFNFGTTFPPFNTTTKSSPNLTLPIFNITIPPFSNIDQGLNISFPGLNFTDMQYDTTVNPFNDSFYFNNATFTPSENASVFFYPTIVPENFTYIDNNATTKYISSFPPVINITTPKGINVNAHLTTRSTPFHLPTSFNLSTTSLPTSFNMSTPGISFGDVNTTLPPTLWVTLTPINASGSQPIPTEQAFNNVSLPATGPNFNNRPNTPTSKYLFNTTFPPELTTQTFNNVPPIDAISFTSTAPPTSVTPPSLPTSCPAGNITIPGLSCDRVFKCPAGSSCYYGFCCLPYEMVQVPACLVDFVVTDVCPSPPEPDQCRYDKDCGPAMTCCLNSCDRRVCRPTVNPKPSKPR